MKNLFTAMIPKKSLTVEERVEINNKRIKEQYECLQEYCKLTGFYTRLHKAVMAIYPLMRKEGFNTDESIIQARTSVVMAVGTLTDKHEKIAALLSRIIKSPTEVMDETEEQLYGHLDDMSPEELRAMAEEMNYARGV